MDENIEQPCSNCEGVGAIWDDQTGQPDEPNGGRMVTCDFCEGTGHTRSHPGLADREPWAGGFADSH